MTSSFCVAPHCPKGSFVPYKSEEQISCSVHSLCCSSLSQRQSCPVQKQREQFHPVLAIRVGCPAGCTHTLELDSILSPSSPTYRPNFEGKVVIGPLQDPCISLKALLCVKSIQLLFSPRSQHSWPHTEASYTGKESLGAILKGT